MDWTLFWTVIAAIAAIVVPVGLYVWSRRQKPRDEAAQAIREFMAYLRDRHVLFEPVAEENPNEAVDSLYDIRSRCADLVGVLTAREDKDAAERIRDASREAARAIKSGRRQAGASEGFNWFEDALNAYRDQVRPHVEILCTRYRIPIGDRPTIPAYRAGWADAGIAIYVSPPRDFPSPPR